MVLTWWVFSDEGGVASWWQSTGRGLWVWKNSWCDIRIVDHIYTLYKTIRDRHMKISHPPTSVALVYPIGICELLRGIDKVHLALVKYIPPYRLTRIMPIWMIETKIADINVKKKRILLLSKYSRYIVKQFPISSIVARLRTAKRDRWQSGTLAKRNVAWFCRQSEAKSVDRSIHPASLLHGWWRLLLPPVRPFHHDDDVREIGTTSKSLREIVSKSSRGGGCRQHAESLFLRFHRVLILHTRRQQSHMINQSLRRCRMYGTCATMMIALAVNFCILDKQEWWWFNNHVPPAAIDSQRLHCTPYTSPHFISVASCTYFVLQTWWSSRNLLVGNNLKGLQLLNHDKIYRMMILYIDFNCWYCE